jgi:hypothetical protein
MSTEATCWQRLRDRRTLVNNEHCLLDLDARLQALEAEVKSGSLPLIQPGGNSGNGSVPSSEGGPKSSSASNEERLPDITPIPVSMRLPELHELDRQGRCWGYRSTTHEPLGRAWVLGTPVSLQLTRSWCSFTHWLPHWCLPVVEEPDA